MTYKEWVKRTEAKLDEIEKEIEATTAAAHREYFQEDCKCKCKCECNPHRMTVQELLHVVDLADRVELAIDGWHLSGTVEALVENLNEDALSATVCSIGPSPMRVDRLNVIAAKDGCKEAENDG